MKKLFQIATAVIGMICGIGAVHAADLPNVKGPPVFAPLPPTFSWTGLYLGGQVGYQWGQTFDPTFYLRATPAIRASLSSYSDSGVAGGAHIGYDWQVSQFVLGLVGDVNGSSYDGSVVGPDTANPALTLRETTRIGIEGSVRGRIGVAWDRVLFYGTGGAAFASIDSSFTTTNAPGSPGVSSTTGRVGWTAGGGIEYAVDPHWTVGIEYRYTDYGRITYALDAIPGGVGTGISLTKRLTDDLVTAGFSYKFDLFAPPAPVVAKY